MAPVWWYEGYAEIGDQRHLGTFAAERESDGIDRIVRNCKSVHFNVANHKSLAGMNSFNPRDAFAESFRQASPQRIHGGLRNVQRRLPQTQHLRQAIAVVGVFVSNQDAVKVIDGQFQCGESRQRFAFTQASINKESGPRCLE